MFDLPQTLELDPTQLISVTSPRAGSHYGFEQALGFGALAVREAVEADIEIGLADLIVAVALGSEGPRGRVDRLRRRRAEKQSDHWPRPLRAIDFFGINGELLEIDQPRAHTRHVQPNR